MLAEPQCSIRGCVHFLGVKNDGEESTERPICGAFPDGIPESIAYGNDTHIHPIKGDHGIQFEKGQSK